MATELDPLTKTGPRITEDDVHRLEQQLGLQLPADYRRFLLEVNGGRAPCSHCVVALRRGSRQNESRTRAS